MASPSTVLQKDDLQERNQVKDEIYLMASAEMSNESSLHDNLQSMPSYNSVWSKVQGDSGSSEVFGLFEECNFRMVKSEDPNQDGPVSSWFGDSYAFDDGHTNSSVYDFTKLPTAEVQKTDGNARDDSSPDTEVVCMIAGESRRRFLIEKSRFLKTSFFVERVPSYPVVNISVPCFYLSERPQCRNLWTNDECLFESYARWLQGDNDFFLKAVVTMAEPTLMKAYQSQRIAELWTLGDHLSDRTFKNRIVDDFIDWIEAKWEMQFKILDAIIQTTSQWETRRFEGFYDEERAIKLGGNWASECPLVRCAIMLYVTVARHGSRKLQMAKQRLSGGARTELDRAIGKVRSSGLKKSEMRNGLRIEKQNFHI